MDVMWNPLPDADIEDVTAGRFTEFFLGRPEVGIMEEYEREPVKVGDRG